VEPLAISTQLIESLPDAVFVVREDGNISFVNAQAERLFGYDRSELLGQPIETLVPEDAHVVHPDHRAHYLENAQVRPMGAGLDLSARRKDGSSFPAEISLSSFETQDGRLVTAVVRDATERKRTQAKFQGLLEAAPDAMLGVDSEGRIQLVNTQAERLFGYHRDELLGKPIETLVPERARGGHPKHREGYFKDPQVRPMGAGIDLSGRRKDGSEFPAEISLSSIEGEDGILVTAAVRDVSERKSFEAVVARARDIAENSARSRQEFLANMSHEIRTPMNAVIGMTSLLLDTALDHQQRDYVETVRTSGEHLLTIINDILDYAKIDAGKLLLEELPFDLRDWLQGTLDLITLQAHEKGLELVYDVAPDVPAIIVGDPGRLRQILVNLLSNAVKFTDTGEVVVGVAVERVEADAVWLRMIVTDTGVGVSAGRIESLFDPFTQADTTTTRLYGGTGLGLAISRRLAISMGGEITLESTPGVGTTVTLLFRAGAQEGPAPATQEALKGTRMLLVEDNTTTRRIVSGWATRHEMECVAVEGAAEALKVLDEDEHFTFVVVDLLMPGVDGAALGELLRARLPDARSVLLAPAGPYAREVVDQGIFDAVHLKPPRQEKLFDVLASLRTNGRTTEAPTSPAMSAFDLPGPSRRLSILVVEDTPVNQKVAQHLLARFGYRADVAASGQEALTALEHRDYDLVLMDVQMPEMDGLEATRLIRRRWPERPVRIVAMTANVAPEDIRRCHEAGMNGFLGKPIVVEALARVLAELMAASPRPPADPEPPPGPVLLDGSVVDRLCDQIGVGTVRQIADMFLADFELALPTLVTACEQTDRGVLAKTAHRLKSSARSLGALGLGELLDTLEQEAVAADWATLEDLVRRIEAHRDPSRDALYSRLATH
jgi:PAS domain S-box-containing protein